MAEKQNELKEMNNGVYRTENAELDAELNRLTHLLGDAPLQDSECYPDNVLFRVGAPRLAIPAILLRCVPEAALYTICFTSLKQYAGGAHASRHWQCLVGFTVMVFGAAFLARLVPIAAVKATTIALALAGLLMIWLRAPVPHPGNPKSPRKRLKLRRVSLRIAFIQCVLLIFGALFAPAWMAAWLLCGAMGLATTGLTLFLPMAPASEGGEMK